MSFDIVQRAPDRRPLVHGVVVMTTFGLGWALLALTGLDLPVAVLVVMAAAAVATAIATVVGANRAIGRLPDTTGSQRTVLPTAGRYFQLVNLAQWSVMVVAVLGLVRVEQSAFIPPVVCAVVGAHFLPLSRIFDLPLYMWTGAVLVLVAGAGALALMSGVDEGPVRTAVGLPAAAVLWATATAVARRPHCQSEVRRPGMGCTTPRAGRDRQDRDDEHSPHRRPRRCPWWVRRRRWGYGPSQ